MDRNIASVCFGSTVGLMSMGATARVLRSVLTAFDMRVIAYDPDVSQADARSMEIELVPLNPLFEWSDVVSLHVPRLNETVAE